MNFYLHIPFCRQKCPYCKFALTPIFDEAKKRRYLAHLRNEIKTYFHDRPSETISTIYFGGGTPSVLSLKEVGEILELFPRKENAEISFECNPEDIMSGYIAGLFTLGINRLSIGIQSLDDTTLRAIHRSDQGSIFRALESVDAALLSSRRDPFQNHLGEQDKENLLSKGKSDSSAPLRNDKKRKPISINIDFILGLPYQKAGKTLENIRTLHEKFPFITHTSVYMLEDGLYPREWKADSMSETEMEKEYSDICSYFETLGWHHYEVSSWARAGYECQHNQGYWNHRNYRGFGLSATSYVGGKRWENSHSFAGYYRGEYASEEILGEAEITLEKIIHDLRTFRLSSLWYPKSLLEKLQEKGYIEIPDGKIILTPAGIFRENSILTWLIEENSKEKM